jgi:hypothetical protein
MLHALFELAVGFLPKRMQTAYTAVAIAVVTLLAITILAVT